LKEVDMGCVNPDGTLSTQAEAILRVLVNPTELEVVARETGLPLYRVRSAVRELTEANLVQQTEGIFRATSTGLELIGSSQS
jgi:predicted methyltransferase